MLKKLIFKFLDFLRLASGSLAFFIPLLISALVSVFISAMSISDFVFLFVIVIVLYISLCFYIQDKEFKDE